MLGTIGDREGKRSSILKSQPTQWISQLITPISNSMHSLILVIEELIRKQDLANAIEITLVMTLWTHPKLCSLHHPRKIPPMFANKSKEIPNPVSRFKKNVKSPKTKMRQELCSIIRLVTLTRWTS
jgi:hypothetical protein